MSYNGLLIHNCQLGTAASSQTSLGEWIYTYSYSSTNTPCRMVPITAAQRVELQGKYDDVVYRGFFKSGASLIAGEFLQYNSQEYRIRDSRYDSSGHHQVVLLEEK